VLRKEVRGKRILPNNEGKEDVEMFQMDQDKDFKGLRPHQAVGE
jgi:hypothetical protein